MQAIKKINKKNQEESNIRSNKMITEIDKKSYVFVLTVILSTAISLLALSNGHVILQGIIILITTYLITGNRPEFIYAIVLCLPRDYKYVLKLYVWMYVCMY